MNESHSNLDPLPEKYYLKIFSYPDSSALADSCRAIYGSADRNLIAAMASTPYEVGRSFTNSEFERLHETLRNLEIAHEFTESNSSRKVYFSVHTRNTENSGVSQSALKVFSSPNFKKKCIVILGLGLLALGGFFLFKTLPLSRTTEESEIVISKKQGLEKESQSLPQTTASTAQSIEFDAELRQPRNRVEIRRSNELGWTAAEEESALRNRDSIRTSSNSSARLVYRTGSTVNIFSDSLVIVGRSEKQASESDDHLQIESGDLRASVRSGPQSRSLEIQTPRGRLRLDPKQGNTQLKTSIRDGQLRIQVDQGSAQFVPSSRLEKSESDQFEVSANHQLQIDPSGLTEKSSYTPSIELFSPKPDHSVKLSEVEIISFEWESLGPDASYRFIVSSYPDLSTPLVDQNLSTNKIELRYLDSGNLFWGVETVREAIQYRSEARSIYVE